MATDLSLCASFLREFGSIEPILPDHPGPGEHVRFFQTSSRRLGNGVLLALLCHRHWRALRNGVNE